MAQTKITKPIKKNSEKQKPSWLKTTDKEVEAIIVKLAKQNLTSEKIGLVLRDTYGIPKAKLLGKRISRVLKEKNLYEEATLRNLQKKEEAIKKHLEKNKQDKKTKRALAIVSQKIKKLGDYRKKKEK